TIDVKSAVGVGTEFVITLPLTKEARNIAAQADVKPAGGNEKILIVDDEPEMLNLLEMLLKELGYTVIAANNGREAVEVEDTDIHLVTLDMMMPKMDGMTALRFLRHKRPDVKVLISSGYTSPEKVPMLERIGIEGFIQKPFEVRKIATTVRDV